ncbi:MAG: phosphomethylpyrimidine synthase ThiC [Desulfovibrionales bacterium]
MHILKKNTVLEKLLKTHGAELAAFEELAVETVQNGVDSGTMVLLANPSHKGVTPTLIGQPAAIKVNANIGTSPLANDPELEVRKLQLAVRAGAHAVMDLSIGGDLERIRGKILSQCPVPLGTVPIYSVAQRYIGAQKDPSAMRWEEILEEIAKQAEQGVDFMTVHCGVTRRAAELATSGDRILGIVSRGGSLLAKWMRDNGRENPLYERYDEILEIALQHNVVLSLGDGMRPGAGADAGDPAQWEEVVVLAELATRAREAGVQVMIEGPGHVPLHQVQAQIQSIKNLCSGAPLYVLGPLTTDISPGYDHIAGAIGGAMAGFFGADFLCYLTPAEHLTLPCENDVWQGVKASLVAAHAAEVALGRGPAVTRNNKMSQARRDLDWEAMEALALDPTLVAERRKEFRHKEECAMCGEFCAVKLLK